MLTAIKFGVMQSCPWNEN